MTRAYYYSAGCGHGLAPQRRRAGVHGSLSPGLAEMIALAGSQVPFAKAAMLIARLAGIQLTVKRVEQAPEASGATAERPRPPRRRHCAAGPDPAAAAVPGPGHVLHRGRRDRDTGPPVRDRRPPGQGRRRRGGHPRGETRPHEPSRPACAGPSTEPTPSSCSDASTPADDGTTCGPARPKTPQDQPGYGQPSDRQPHSDTQVSVPHPRALL
jgi:hypothetical protein